MAEANPSSSVLVADIGGTNARFAIARVDVTGAIAGVGDAHVLQAADFETVRDAVDAYFEIIGSAAVGGERPRRACFAIAGPVGTGEIRLTNAHWTIDPDSLSAQLGFAPLRVVNDWAAAARGVLAEPAQAAELLAPGTSDPAAPIVAFGPGTGLGLGYCVQASAGVTAVVSTEGGHAAFAPRDERELAVWRFIHAEHQYVSYERLLSGRGLVSIHRALCARAGAPRANLRPDEITEAALSRDPGLPIARDAVETFCAVLGTYAASVVLTLGARGGACLGGGIAPRILPILRESQFVERFRDAGPMSRYLADVPVRVMPTTGDVALLGAAAFALDSSA